ncbi:hypothetical protein uav_103 [Pseudomonas phage UAVern]|uniref:Uncharacterized protein n=1 Tax=Pseudomonas phage UAVern TaxID=2856997 RepID=A0A975UUE6_9CAUD|nr:hypothetical protein uav_103 [Pseudomonas phage UAVern]
MASDILTYSPADVKLILCGYILTGVVSVTLQWKGARPFRVIRGIRGKHTRVFNPDLYAVVVVELLQTSISNDIFTSILVQDRQNKSARLEFGVNDKSGTTSYQSSDCFIGAYPDVSFSGELTTYKWEIECLDFISGGIGGNARQGFDILDSANGAIDYISGKGSEFIDSATSFLS